VANKRILNERLKCRAVGDDGDEIRIPFIDSIFDEWTSLPQAEMKRYEDFAALRKSQHLRKWAERPSPAEEAKGGTPLTKSALRRRRTKRKQAAKDVAVSVGQAEVSAVEKKAQADPEFQPGS
jgi:hypothetical protein